MGLFGFLTVSRLAEPPPQNPPRPGLKRRSWGKLRLCSIPLDLNQCYTHGLLLLDLNGRPLMNARTK